VCRFLRILNVLAKLLRPAFEATVLQFVVPRTGTKVPGREIQRYTTSSDLSQITEDAFALLFSHFDLPFELFGVWNYYIESQQDY
jgi:hypothetical protein